MPTYTMEVFQWTGTYYNAQYNESHTAVFNDDDGSVGGSSDSNETVSIDGGASNVTGGQPYKIEVNFTDSSGNDHVEDFNFFYTSDGGWYFAPQEGSNFDVGSTLGSYQSHTIGWDYDEVVCFASGTLITTDTGDRRVENLRPGDMILTQDGTFKELRMNVRREITGSQLQETPSLRPIRIVTGALGAGLPKRDLLVSRQHRFLVTSQLTERLLGCREALIAAAKLTDLPGIFVEDTCQPVSYHHLLLDEHEVIFAEGAPAESLLTGDHALKSLIPDFGQDALSLFPHLAELADKKSAFNIPSNEEQKKLVDQHKKRGKSVVS